MKFWNNMSLGVAGAGNPWEQFIRQSLAAGSAAGFFKGVR